MACPLYSVKRSRHNVENVLLCKLSFQCIPTQLPPACGAEKETKRVSFMQERSYSCGDLSPSDEGWSDNEERTEHDDGFLALPHRQPNDLPVPLLSSQLLPTHATANQNFHNEHACRQNKTKMSPKGVLVLFDEMQ